MRIPFVGGTYQMNAVSFDNQRCVNLYPILSESGTSKSVAALRNVAGYVEFTTVGGGGIRGCLESSNRAFFVSATDLYEVFADGTSTLRGTLDTATGRVFMEENPTQVMITDGIYGYIFTKSTNTFAKITDVDFPTPSSLTFQDGYFIVTEANTSKFWISNLNNGLAWDTLDFTTVESSPDNLVAAYSDSSNLWLFGTKSTEVYQNTGAAAFPFQRISGALIETGCAAAETVQEIDNRLFWLGTDDNGDSVVWVTNGYNAQRVSTQAIEKKISESVNFNESYAWTYHERGHAFYVLQVKGLNTTLVYDVSTRQWHERISLDPNSMIERQFRGSCHLFFNKKHLVGDFETNQIFDMSLNYYDYAGLPMIKERITPHISDERRLITHSSFELDMEVGVGLVSGQGSDPQIMMSYSDDGGHTFSTEIFRSFGKIGKYLTRVVWRKLGRSRDRVYKVRVSDPVFVQFNDAFINNT